MVPRCNDRIYYHLLQTVESGNSDDEFSEALITGLIVGGSIVIPHLRHAVESIEILWHRSQQGEDIMDSSQDGV